MPFVLAAVVGCSTIHSARDAQREVAAKGAEEVVAAAQDKVALGACSLPELVEFALTNRPSMISANLAVTDARLALKQIAADAPLVSETPWTAPKLSVSGGHSERSPGSTIGDLDLSTEGNPSAALSLELPVWDFGRNAAAAKAQAERVTAAELAHNRLVDHLRFAGAEPRIALLPKDMTARIKLVRLEGEGDDITVWQPVAGSERTMLPDAKGEVAWSVEKGAWRLTLEIVCDGEVVQTESSLFDLRNLKPDGMVLLLR